MNISDKELEQAKNLINSFCIGEFGNATDFTKLSSVNIAYTTITDAEIPIQVTLDLERYYLMRTLDGHVIDKEEYGCDFRFEEVGEEFRKVKDENDKVSVRRFVLVEAEGTSIVNGWKFVATLNHTEEGNIIRAACDIEIPERFYICSPCCEHCNSNRPRKETYIVMNEKTGEFKQVGKSCLKDFTNGMSIEGVSAYMSFFNDLIQGEAPNSNGLGPHYYDTKRYLHYVAETISHWGFVRRGVNERSTADRAAEYMMLDTGDLRGNAQYAKILRREMESVVFSPESSSIDKTVEEAYTWLMQQEETDNYMHNLITACKLEYTTYKNFGILASLFPTYNRSVEKEKRSAEAKAQQEPYRNSEWIGKEKERINITVSTFSCLTSWENDYGYTYIYRITDDKNNVYTWKTSNCLGENSVKSLTGTVKTHTEYRGIKQTELTRCRVEAKEPILEPVEEVETPSSVSDFVEWYDKLFGDEQKHQNCDLEK